MTEKIESRDVPRWIVMGNLPLGMMWIAQAGGTESLNSIRIDKAEFLAAVEREFDVTITANPKPPKVGDVVDRETAFGLPPGSLVESAGGHAYLLTDNRMLTHRNGSSRNRNYFEGVKFTIKYIGGNA